jgi:DNA-binding SARP family transcriptional activator
MQFGLLGPLEVACDGTTVPIAAAKQRAVLAALLLDAGRVVSLDELAEVLWGTRPPTTARASLQNCVMRLRRALGDPGRDLIGTRPGGYVITVDPSQLDVCRFEALLEAARAAVRAGSWRGAGERSRAALALWRGEPLADVGSELLALRDAPRLAEMRLQALEARAGADLQLGRHTEVIGEFRRLVFDHPLRERLHAMLMLALYRDGRQGEALAAYAHARRVLVDELGAEPGAELKELQRQILAGGAALAGAGGPHAAAGGAGAAAQPAVPRLLPAAAQHFCGRARELAALTRPLDAAARPAAGAGTVAVSVISGTAGVGKTALAVYWAHQVAARFPDGQLYVNLRGFSPAGEPLTPAQVVRTFLDALGVPADQVPADPDAQAGLYRSVLAGKRVLIVLDNARTSDQVRPLLPASPGCLVAVTSRCQLTGLVATEGALPLSLDVLTQAEARELLTRRLGAERIMVDSAAVDELIRLCAHLPLALTIAAARTVARSGSPIAALNAELRDAHGRLDALDGGDLATNVRAVFSWSCQSLTPPAARAFRLLGLHRGLDISARAAASLARLAPAQTRAVLAELTRANLLTEHTPGRFGCHDLLRAYAAEQVASVDSATCRQAAVHRVLDYYLHSAHAAAALLYPGRGTLALDPPCPGAVVEDFAGYQQAWAWLATECGALIAMTSLAASSRFDVHAWQIPWALVEFLDRHGRRQDWAATQHVALAAAGRLGDVRALARVHRDLGLACAKLGLAGDALAHLWSAFGLHQQAGDLAGLARVHYALAQVSERQGDLQRALGHAQQALELHRRTGHRGGVARTLNSVGWYHALLGNHRRALAFCELAITSLREVGDRAGEADTWDSLGYAHHCLGHHTEAMACYKKALAPYRVLGDRRSEAALLTRIGDTHRAAGSPHDARAAWQKALTILDDMNAPAASQVRAKLRHLTAATLAT